MVALKIVFTWSKSFYRTLLPSVHIGHKPSGSEKPIFFLTNHKENSLLPGIYTVFILYKNKAFCEQSEASSVRCLIWPPVLNFRQTFKHQCLPLLLRHQYTQWRSDLNKQTSFGWHVKSYPLVKSSTLWGAGLMRSEAHTILRVIPTTWQPATTHFCKEGTINNKTPTQTDLKASP